MPIEVTRSGVREVRWLETKKMEGNRHKHWGKGWRRLGGREWLKGEVQKDGVVVAAEAVTPQQDDLMQTAEFEIMPQELDSGKPVSAFTVGGR